MGDISCWVPHIIKVSPRQLNGKFDSLELKVLKIQSKAIFEMIVKQQEEMEISERLNSWLIVNVNVTWKLDTFGKWPQILSYVGHGNCSQGKNSLKMNWRNHFVN